MIDLVLLGRDFLSRAIPSWQEIVMGGPIALVWSFLCLSLSGFLKKHNNWQTGYSRKCFHFLIFFSAAFTQWLWGIQGVCLFGGMCSLVILYALVRGNGTLLYEALAREQDEPHRTLYIVIPYLATLLGGLISVICWERYALVGYRVTGLADGLAEPVGTRFGRHRYRVLAVGLASSERSIEGSLTVLASSMIAVMIAALMIPTFADYHSPWFLAIVIGGVSMFIEALTPHGWDNLTLQITPAWLTASLLAGGVKCISHSLQLVKT